MSNGAGYPPLSGSTVYPRITDPFYVVGIYINWAKTSWTFSINVYVYQPGKSILGITCMFRKSCPIMYSEYNYDKTSWAYSVMTGQQISSINVFKAFYYLFNTNTSRQKLWINIK